VPSTISVVHCRLPHHAHSDALLELTVVAFGQPDFAHAALADRAYDAVDAKSGWRSAAARIVQGEKKAA